MSTSAPPPVLTGSPLLGSAHRLLDAHRHNLGPLPDPASLLDLVAASGLTGRGGGGFPVARKLAAVIDAAGAAPGTPVVVGNGAEGEPASSKDHLLLTTAPHLVLDGLVLAAGAVGADRAHLLVMASALPAVRAALAERTDRIPVQLTPADDRFVAGEESAVVSAVEGRAAVPRDKRHRVTERGVHGRPTAVQNVETLAHLALVARFGAGWFRSRGTAAEPGTMLVTVSGGVRRPGVYEVAHGTPLPEVLEAAWLTAPGPVLVGGFHGAWLGADEVAGAALSRESLGAFGASPGAGVLIALPPGASGMAETARITAYLAGQSARQCGPCVHGLPRMADALARADAGDLHRLTGLAEGRGACHHPDGTVRLVRSALRVFGGRP